MPSDKSAVIANKKNNPMYNGKVKVPHAIIVSNAVDHKGKLEDPIKLDDRSLACELNMHIHQEVYLHAVREINWASHLYIILTDTRGKPIQAIVSDCGRSGFYLAQAKINGDEYYITKVMNSRSYGKPWPELSNPSAFYYLIRARSLIAKIEAITKL
jgi:hypothetical protein